MKKIFSILLLLSSFTASATRWHIATTGNDATGNGTAGNPWLTLNKACTTVTTAGDTIYVNAGTYTETVVCNLAVGVHLMGAGQWVSILRSTVTTTFTPMLFLSSAEGTAGNQTISHLRFEGQLTTQFGILVSGRSNVEIHHCRFYDFFDVGVAFRGRTDFADGAPHFGAPTIYSNNNSFHDNYMWNCANIDDSYGRGCLEIGGQTNILVYNDTIIQTARATGFNGYCIKNINQGWIRGIKVFNSYLEVNPFHCSSNGGCNNRWDFAFELSDVQGLEFYNNRVLGSCDQNFQTRGSFPNSVYYHDNEFGWPSLNANPTWGIILEYSTSDAKFERNTFRNVTIPFWFIPRSGDTLHRDTIRNNLAYGMGTSGGYDGRAIKQQGDYSNNAANGWVIDNNTFVGRTGGQGTFGIDIPLGSTAGVSNNKCRNNIVTNFTVAIHSGGGGNMSNILINNNLTNNVSTAIDLGGTPTGTYSTAGNISAAPNLDVSYHPNVGSPAIDAGINVGIAYNGSAPDIGFFETGGADVTPPTVTGSSPSSGATNVNVSADITVFFNEALNPATVTTGSCSIAGVTVAVSYSGGVITMNPAVDLAPATTYTATISTAVTDAAGNALASAFNFSFTTAAAPPPGGGGSLNNYKLRRRWKR